MHIYNNVSLSLSLSPCLSLYICAYIDISICYSVPCPQAMQDKMDSFEAAQKENAGKFMTRMASGNDESLKNLCLESWIKYHNDCPTS